MLPATQFDKFALNSPGRPGRLRLSTTAVATGTTANSARTVRGATTTPNEDYQPEREGEMSKIQIGNENLDRGATSESMDRRDGRDSNICPFQVKAAPECGFRAEAIALIISPYLERSRESRGFPRCGHVLTRVFQDPSLAEQTFFANVKARPVGGYRPILTKRIEAQPRVMAVVFQDVIPRAWAFGFGANHGVS